MTTQTSLRVRGLNWLRRFVRPSSRKQWDATVFKGAHGLQGLLDSQEFWDQQPYGTRLYYGDGIADYLHRDVLRAAVRHLDKSNTEMRNDPPSGK